MNHYKPILLVEDNPNDEALTLRALRKGNIANPVEVIRDGAEALDYLLGKGKHTDRAEAELPSVIILDLKLPKVGGLSVLKQLRQNERTAMVPVVVLTSSDEQRDQIESYRLGANSYVRKPVGFEGFSSAVQQLGLYWVLLNQIPAKS